MLGLKTAETIWPLNGLWLPVAALQYENQCAAIADSNIRMLLDTIVCQRAVVAVDLSDIK